MERTAGRALGRPWLGVLAMALAVVGCGTDLEQTEYSEANRDAFLAACTEAGQDDQLIRDVCECAYEEIESSLLFADLAALDESLELDALRPLPEEIAGHVADCFLAEVDL